ncbi:Eukaryotic translation initiation factor 2c [Fasciola hepatica]|uniref:Eukaryotic translation initiation factor 2c n=1 Tax=Fasciola hepatica TaxID=6192 RepID=A0A4E0S195_FASHE|nr:Eukaryotic translation initiation factor 2c [Fasciola hepatica]
MSGRGFPPGSGRGGYERGWGRPPSDRGRGFYDGNRGGDPRMAYGPPPSAFGGRGGPRQSHTGYEGHPGYRGGGPGPYAGSFDRGMPPPIYPPSARGRGMGSSRGAFPTGQPARGNAKPRGATGSTDRGRDQSSESLKTKSLKPTERGDTLSAASSTENLPEAARQKKSHPIVRPGADLASALSKLQIQRSIRIPSRPDAGGQSGAPAEVLANCWDISVNPKSVLMYFVETIAVFRFDKTKGEKTEIRMPPKEKRALIQQIVDALPTDVIYDGGHTVYSEQPIPGVSKEGVQKTMEIKDPLNRDQLLLEYRIMEVQTVSTEDVKNYTANEHATSLDMPQTCKAFFTCGNLADVMYNKYGDNMLQCSRQMANDLRRIRVETIPFYTTEKGEKYSRRFTVHGISSESASTLMIDDIKQSVEKYFLEHHKIALKYPELPCVKVSLSRDVFMPMELLTILPYQAPNAKKSDIASEVIRCAAVRVHDRFRELQTFVGRLLQSSHSLSSKFGLKVNDKPVKTPARVLDPPRASFGKNSEPLQRGSWNTSSFYLAGGGSHEVKWAVVAVPGDRAAQKHLSILSQELPRNAARFNLRLGRPEIATASRASIDELFRNYQSHGVQLVVLVLYDDLHYPSIKRLGDIQTGMRTQCVRGRTLDKPRVIPNLLLKINGKLGGINWQIQDLMRNDELIMVFGADVTHPAPTQTQHVRQSIAAILGSITPDLMRYAVVVRQQATTERESKTTREIIDAMESVVTELLTAFGRNNNDRLPTRLIFYRDGVSEGQFENVLVEELASIQKACSNLRSGYEPAITYIVVQKRHHVRFQPLDPRSKNVAPGTVVDTHVTHPREFDFYLCSQEGIQGTSKPAHYHVLYDDSDWSSDALQNFTYFLCHAYMRCSRSVSYPAPTYYAHLAAFRARDWISDLTEPAGLLQEGKFRVHNSQTTGMFYL